MFTLIKHWTYQPKVHLQILSKQRTNSFWFRTLAQTSSATSKTTCPSPGIPTCTRGFQLSAQPQLCCLPSLPTGPCESQRLLHIYNKHNIQGASIGQVKLQNILSTSVASTVKIPPTNATCFQYFVAIMDCPQTLQYLGSSQGEADILYIQI